MGDVVGSMLRERKSDNVEPEGTLVTALVKYDIFPKYLVVKGYLQPDFTVKTNPYSFYRTTSILQILPAESYESEKERLQRIEDNYYENERQLRIDILKENGVDFVSVK